MPKKLTKKQVEKKKEENKFKKPSLEEIMKCAHETWDKARRLLPYPSKESYLLFVEDTYKTLIDPMSQEDYESYLKAQQKLTIERLQGIYKWVKGKLDEKVTSGGSTITQIRNDILNPEDKK